MKNINPTTTAAWSQLQKHFQEIKHTHLKTLFEEEKNRAEAFSIRWRDFYVDYSKHRIDKETHKLLLDLAQEVDLPAAIKSYFEGDRINETENRAVLHTGLRQPAVAKVMLDGEDVNPEVQEVKQHIERFSRSVISGSHKGYTGKSITDVVNVGIGGSDLGPVMITEALAFYKNHLNIHFVSNVDGDHVQEVLKKLNPETTLFVIVSKTFTTQETLTNANTIREWFVDRLLPQAGVSENSAISRHFAAVSTNVEAIEKFGIDADNVFPMWNWVGGRFSLWSAVGLSIALSVGYENFERLLEGAYDMDRHFRESKLEKNIPVVLALLTVWYNNFFGAETQAIIPYTQYLHRFPAYLQQAIMESNGKHVDRNGKPVDYQTGTVIWGEPGTNSQHAFFQLIHQGTKLIPADFIGFKRPLYLDSGHHDKLMANFFAQTEALMNGKTEEQVSQELKTKGLSEKEIKQLLPFKVFDGNKPTTTVLIDQLTPRSLGSLIAMYEHKIFVEGVIWNIFSYDQWGVELGKQLATKILNDLEQNDFADHDSSTKELLTRYRKR
ncbi:glucose-6-phosphate isomerase [Croceiramulus getboli]|nr:glucose-6-phosphate isomerase [Flavobacteriaceae bacterium YJPT1-3]